MEKKKTCMCKTCGRSSNFGNTCLYEEKEQMCFCSTFIRPMKKKIIVKKDK